MYYTVAAAGSSTVIVEKAKQSFDLFDFVLFPLSVTLCVCVCVCVFSVNSFAVNCYRTIRKRPCKQSCCAFAYNVIIVIYYRGLSKLFSGNKSNAMKLSIYTKPNQTISILLIETDFNRHNRYNNKTMIIASFVWIMIDKWLSKADHCQTNVYSIYY